MNRSVPRLPSVLVRVVAAIGAVVLAGIAPALVDAQAPAPLVIVGGTLIDGNGGTPVADALVIVQGDRISSVSRRGQTSIPANAQVIRADGKFILPGLWDTQVSYSWYYGEVMLNYGITSTIDVGIAGEIGAPHRDAVHKGFVRGPRPFTGLSRFTTEPVGGTGLETPGTPGRTPKTGQEAREFVRAWVELGADMIQFAEGGLPMEIYTAGADEARRLGKPTFMRACGPILGPREAAMLGTRNLPHSAGIAARSPGRRSLAKTTRETRPTCIPRWTRRRPGADRAARQTECRPRRRRSVPPTAASSETGTSLRSRIAGSSRPRILRCSPTTRPSASKRRSPSTVAGPAELARCASGDSRDIGTRCASTRCSLTPAVTCCRARTRIRSGYPGTA